MTAAADRLRQHAAEATASGPWIVRTGEYAPDVPYVAGIDLGSEDFIETDGGHYGPRIENARLIALAPELALLCADMADALAYVDGWRDRVGIQSPAELLARLDRLTAPTSRQEHG